MNKFIGSTLDSMFEETGELDEVNLLAQKKGLAEAVRAQMARLSVTKTALARTMGTSRSQVERLLDPADTSLTLVTLAKASAALGMTVQVALRAKRRERRVGAARSSRSEQTRRENRAR